MTQNSASHHHPKNRQLGRRFYGLMIIFAALAVLIIFAVFFNQKVSQREKLAASLPSDHTVAFLEYNFDPSRSDTKELQNLAAQNTLAQGALDFFNAVIPSPEQFYQWYGNRGGLALLQNQNGHGMSIALFLQVTNRDQAIAWLNQLVLDPKNDALIDEDYLGQKLISFRSGQTYNILLTGDFLIISENIDNLKMIADTVYGNRPALRNRSDYNKLISALPDQNPFFLFLDRGKLLDELGRSELFLAGHLSSYKLYFPFLNLVSTEGIAVNLTHTSDQKPQLTAQHLALFNPATLPTPDFFATDYSYDGNLEKFLPPGTFLTAGGVNLLDQKNKLSAYFKNRSSIYELLFSGMLSQLKDTVQNPGNTLDLDQDFFPLFQKQYLFFASQEAIQSGANKMPSLGLILESSSPESDSLKMEKILMVIGGKITSQIDAKPVAVTLPDGTQGKQLIATLSAPQKQSIQVAGHNAEQIQFSSDFSLFLYADTANKHLLITNSADVLSQLLASGNTASTVDYALPKPTETYHLDIKQISQLWPAAAVLKPLQSITIARKFTEIGILSTYQLGF